ncbi:CD209 antigen-like protein E isoform X2 [Clupea harengus]|uniref:CD209 antigen-like protein E isoform X2 n=1 Tax=Clupea harengus TaxID=7950 RepID=A0A6P8ES86_CLUHA|nr:CD209 antigen-like protein E isoform X2 [Clupea harengus]
MDHLYGNVQGNKTDERHRGPASQTTVSTKALIPLLIVGLALLFSLAALGTMTYLYANKRSDEQKKYALLEARYKNLSADLNDTAKCGCRVCPEGWIHHRGKCYLFPSSKKNWEQSRDHCITLGGHLAIVNDKQEQDFLVAKSNQVSHWIGLNDLAVEGQWRWVDSSSLSDTKAVFWFDRSHLNGTDEPDNWKKEDPSGENCGCISFRGDWHDNSCKMMKKFVCETLATY